MDDSEVFIVFKLPGLCCSSSKRIINIFQLSPLMINKHKTMESFYIFIWKFCSQTALCFERKIKTKIKFWIFVLICCTWNTVNTNGRMNFFFWYCLNTTVKQIQRLQHWYSKCSSKEICLSAQNNQARHAPPHVSIITGKILITITRFARYHLLFASTSTFMTNS